MVNVKYLYSKSISSVRFNIAMSLLLLWTLMQLLIPINFLPYDVLHNIEYLKITTPIIVIVSLTLLYVNKLLVSNILWPFILFNILVLTIFIVKYFFLGIGFSILQDLIKYIVWSIAVFVLFPSILNSLYKVEIFLRVSVILLSLFFIFMALITLSFNIDVSYFNKGRLGLLYDNPLYLGGIAYSLLCASLILRELSDSNFEKRILVVLVVVSMWVIYLSYTRTFALAIFVIYLSYSFNIGNNFKKLLLFNFFILLLIIAVYFIFLENINLNKISSNRLLNWESTMNNDVDYIQFFLGRYVDSGYDQILFSKSGVAIKQTFQRFANDNAYLEIFINTGAFVLLLFILGLKKLFPTGMMRGLKKVDGEGGLVRVLSLAYAVLISLIVTGFFYGSFPSIGNTMNSIVFPVVVSIILILKRCIGGLTNLDRKIVL
jgi:hypothetical protein